MKALVLAGGLPQIALIEELHRRGIQAILADGSEKALAKAYADGFYQVNIFDIDAVVSIAKNEQVDFVITCCADQVLLVVAQVSEILGLPFYIDYETAQRVSDKELMKKTFVDHGIPTARHVVMKNLDPAALSGLRYPLIVKPVDAYSSRGVRRVNSAEELSAAFDTAVSISRSGSAIIEEFCAGEELSVDVYVDEGKAHILCVSNSEKVLDEDKFVIFRGRYPTFLSEDLVNQIQDVAQKIADAFHLHNAPMLIQLITDGQRLDVLEFCARTGGAMKYLLIRHVCGFDVIKAVVDLSLGKRPELHLRKPEHNYIVNDFIYCKEGIFDHLEGFEELVSEGLLTEYHALRPRGFVCSGQVNSSSDRVAGITVQADTLDEFNRIHRIIADRIQVIDSHGNDILRRDLLPDLSSSPTGQT